MSDGRHALTASIGALALAEPEAEPAASVGDVPRLIDAMERFAAERSGFESSVVAALVRDEMAAATDVNRAALVPLSHKVFGFDAALMWGFFLANVVPRVIAEDEVVLAPAFVFDFDLPDYYARVATVYDLAVETNVWEYVVGDESDEEDSSEEEESEEESEDDESEEESEDDESVEGSGEDSVEEFSG